MAEPEILYVVTLSGQNLFRLVLLRRRVPALADIGEEFCLVFFDEADEGLIAGLFVGGGPEHHFRQDRREVHPFGGQKIEDFTAVSRVALHDDDAVLFQAAEAVSENVGGDVFAGRKKFLEGAKTANHHIANNQQRPAIAEHFHGSIQGTP